MAAATSSTNGILPVTASIIQKAEANPSHSRNSARKPPGPRLKVVVRRLAPGLTRDEFESAVGQEWKTGQGKVDWFEFRPGKISKDHAKPSRPARAYLHLTDQRWLNVFSDKVRQCAFQDAKNTTRDPALIGPPSLEFAPYTRIPGGRRRNDARQGTIDQDPDFQLFLQSLTDPITKPSATDLDSTQDKEKVTTTPLIEHIREKKANKDKPSVKKAAAKSGKEKEEPKEEKPVEVVVASPAKTRKSAKSEKAAPTPEGAKTPQKNAAATVKAVTMPVSPAAVQTPADSPAGRSAERRRERPPISVAAKIQRDLGLGQPARRRDASGAASSTPNAKATTETTTPSQQGALPSGSAGPAAQASPAATTPQRQGRQSRNRQSSRPPAPSVQSEAGKAPATPTPPVILQKQHNTPAPRSPPKGPAQATQTAPASAPTPQPQIPTPSQQPQQQAPSHLPTAPRSTSTTPVNNSTSGRHAFLKHANPSQGITEPLILEALRIFGSIERVDIDRRKGFAYVDFADAEGLNKAIAASPIKIAQGAVQVLEKKERVAVHHGGLGGGVGGGRAPSVGSPGGLPPTGPAAGMSGARGINVRGPRGGGTVRGRGPSRSGAGPPPVVASPGPQVPATVPAASPAPAPALAATINTTQSTAPPPSEAPALP